MRLRHICEDRSRENAVSAVIWADSEARCLRGESDMDESNRQYDLLKARLTTGDLSHLTAQELWAMAEKIETDSTPKAQEDTFGPYTMTSDHRGRHVVTRDGERLGSCTVSDGGGTETVTARENFVGIVGPQERAGRLHGIEVESGAQGTGLGQWLLLQGFAQAKADWVFNSQLSTEALILFKRLQQKGWIEVHWKKWEGDVFVARITPAGREALANKSFLKRSPA